jgi:hypothetical protein
MFCEPLSILRKFFCVGVLVINMKEPILLIHQNVLFNNILQKSGRIKKSIIYLLSANHANLLTDKRMSAVID